jgi:hypothetical protein
MKMFVVLFLLLINRGFTATNNLRSRGDKVILAKQQATLTPTILKGRRSIPLPRATPVKFKNAPPKGIYTSFPSSAPSTDSEDPSGGTISTLGRSGTKPKTGTNAQLDTSLLKIDGIPPTIQAPPITDVIDVPNTVIGNLTTNVSTSTSEIPPMERIPDDIDAYHQTQARDFIDAPTKLEDSPIILPFGEQAEDYILHQVASVCAISEQDAFWRCQQVPVCKYVTSPTGRITSDLKPGQGPCIHRCDSPLGESQCEPHEQCFHFVLSCKVHGWS